MFEVADLRYNDCPWMPDDLEGQFVHEKIPWSTCKQLGVKTHREGALQNHDAGFPFGQKDELTNRLKRILTGYPGEEEILKELLQNVTHHRNLMLKVKARSRHACTTRLACRRSRICAY